jgi:hypothetical protein
MEEVILIIEVFNLFFENSSELQNNQNFSKGDKSGDYRGYSIFW